MIFDLLNVFRFVDIFKEIMGNYVYKLLTYNDETKKDDTKAQVTVKDIIVEKEGMCTPSLTQRKLSADPRSITLKIERTPIEVNCTPVGYSKRAISAIPKYLQTKPYVETDSNKVTQATPGKHAILKLTGGTSTKPSFIEDEIAQNYLTPTVNGVHHPKVITSTDVECYNILELDPRSPAADFNRTPILALRTIERLRAKSHENLNSHGSTEADIHYSRYSYSEISSLFNIPEIQVLPDMAEDVVKSLYLENFDDKEKMNQSVTSCSSYFSQTETVSETGEEVIENPILNNTRINREICPSPISLDEKRFTKEQKLEDETTITEDELPKTEEIITFYDDYIEREPQLLKINKIDNDSQKKIDIATGTEKKTFKLDARAVMDESKTRTPLGNRSNNVQIQTLLSKSPQQLLRNKGVTPKMLQENIPPQKRYIRKLKLNGMQWDLD